jgi:glycine/D-amino acid oxidase-like deaminating enzyme
MQTTSKESGCIAIIGAGIMGWMLAFALANRGILCKIIDTDPPGGYASTGNQSWMQTGALYLAKPMPDEVTAEACRQGYHYMMGHSNKGLIQYTVPCYFVFHHKQQSQSVIERCRAFGIDARAVSIEEINEPLLKGSDLRYAAQVPDHPFNNSQLLQSIAEQACAGGAQFYPVASLEMIEIKRNGSNLLVSLDTTEKIECKGIILACGAMIPAMLERLLPGQGVDFTLTKNPVLTLRSDISIAKSMLIPPGEPGGPHLVPFSIAEGNGVSVCIPHTEEFITDYRDRHFDPEHLKEFASALLNFYSGIKTLAAEHTILAHVYYCQKLHLQEEFDANQSGRRPIYLSYALEPGAPDNIYALYPGKATAAPILAERCAEELVKQIEGLQVDFNRPRTVTPTIAKPRYCDEAEYRLVVENRKLDFRRRS